MSLTKGVDTEHRRRRALLVLNHAVAGFPFGIAKGLEGIAERGQARVLIGQACLAAARGEPASEPGTRRSAVIRPVRQSVGRHSILPSAQSTRPLRFP